jgi:hypothetical protein
MQSPDGRIQTFSPNLNPNYVFIMRGLNGLEFDGCTEAVPENSKNPQKELALQYASRACPVDLVDA